VVAVSEAARTGILTNDAPSIVICGLSAIERMLNPVISLTSSMSGRLQGGFFMRNEFSFNGMTL
jgi:hypothetical protein